MMRVVLLALVVTGGVSPALAHDNIAGSGLLQGLLHPLHGIDHLLAMLLVGLWAAALSWGGGARRWLLPGGFLAAGSLGGALAAFSVTLPAVETVLLASLLVLGLALVLRPALEARLAIVLVAGLGLYHGHAHVLEAPQGQAWFGYGFGILSMTALLLAAGVMGGRWLLERGFASGLRLAGAAAALIGLAAALT